MKAKRVAPRNVSANSALALLCLFGVVQSTTAKAGDAGAFKPAEAPVAAELGPAEFNERWGGDAEFVLTSSGEIVSSKAPQADGAIGRNSHQIGNALDASDDGESMLYEKPVIQQIGNDALDEATSVSDACGASPLSADQIRSLVIETARRHQVDEDLAVAIAFAESAFDRLRNSPKGARGPMQLMPQTAARFGVTDPCDPAANIDGGVRYLRVLLEEFQNPLLAVAAYNAGEDRIYQYGGIPPFPETVGYVARVVNRQLGLSMPRPIKRKPTDGATSHADIAGETQERGVITARKSGTFVGGVMHF